MKHEAKADFLAIGDISILMQINELYNATEPDLLQRGNQKLRLRIR